MILFLGGGPRVRATPNPRVKGLKVLCTPKRFDFEIPLIKTTKL